MEVWKEKKIRRGSLKNMFIDLLSNLVFLATTLLQQFMIDKVLDDSKTPYTSEDRYWMLPIAAAIPVVLSEMINFALYRKIFNGVGGGTRKLC